PDASRGRRRGRELEHLTGLLVGNGHGDRGAASSGRPSADEGRLVHLGIGNFARAHTLFATQRAGGWTVSAFTGRSARMADALNAQDGKYGLIVRSPEDDEVEII